MESIAVVAVFGLAVLALLDKLSSRQIVVAAISLIIIILTLPMACNGLTKVDLEAKAGTVIGKIFFEIVMPLGLSAFALFMLMGAFKKEDAQ